MATNKTINITNQTVSIPAMADAPDQSVNSNCIDKIIDGLNTLNSKLRFVAAPNDDINNAKDTGMYYCGTSTLNRPEQYCIVYVFAAFSNTTFVQLAMSLFTRKMYLRSYANSTWSAWKAICCSDTHDFGTYFTRTDSSSDKYGKITVDGNMVTVTGQIGSLALSAGSNTVGTLSKFKPVLNTEVPINVVGTVGAGTDIGTFVRVTIDSTGSVKAFANSAVTSTLRFTVTYCTTDI